MKKYSYLAGAAFLAIASSASFASITLQVTTEALNSTLTNNGWVGYELTLVSDGTTSTGIDSIDFANVVAVGGMPQSNIGISGDIHQKWIIDNVDNPGISSGVSSGGGIALGQKNDSFWFTGAGTGDPGNPADQLHFPAGFTSNPNTPSENNLIGFTQSSGPTTATFPATGTNPPFTRSPLNDTTGTVSTGSSASNGTAFGVDTLMTIAGSYDDFGGFPTTTTLAFIIVPSSVATTINGVAVDQNSTDFAITTVLGGVAVPEPASVGLVGLGGLALLARRRRKV